MNKEKNNNVIIGRHVSASSPGFLVGAVKEAISYGANALALYVGSPHTSHRRNVSELRPNEFRKFLERDETINIKNIVVHAPYVMNLGNIFDLDTFQKSVKLLRTDIERMIIIGLETIVLHPGHALRASRLKSISQIVQGINQVLTDNPPVRVALETMSGKGSEIGSSFEEINEIIQQVERKEKVGVCWDTCHLYSAGYDIKDNLETVIKKFDRIIGLDKLWVIHLNDSAFGLGAKKDRHKNVGHGEIGFAALKKIVHHPKFKGIIKILETPHQQDFQEEIKKLKR
jgi:deoxyribonuclease IV